MTNPNETWQIKVNNQIYEANVEEMCQWIAEGALLPADRVRRGNLRWLEARKVPVLLQFFNAKEHGLPFPILQTVTNASAENDSPSKTENLEDASGNNQSEIAERSKNFAAETQPPESSSINAQTSNACRFHVEEEARYICETCANYFCKLCPTSYGASVKICPLCGAMCKPLAEVRAKQQKNYQYQRAATENFGFSDFTSALAYPFKFRSSLIFGAWLFMVFTLGQTASAFGGTIFVASAIVCAMLANSLTFTCLANTIENFSQGNTEADFMPKFDDFSLWDDVIHPFFLSVGVYIISFGLLIVLLVAAFYYAMQSFEQIEADKQKIVSAVFPNEQNELNSARQIPQINETQKRLNEQNEWKNGAMPDEKAITNSQQSAHSEEAEFQKLEEMIRENRRAQLEQVAGETTASERESYNQMAANLLRLSLIFSIPIFLAFLWGVFYFPVACAVAGYTRSFAAVVNPLIGLDTIRRMNLNYAKILLMFFGLGVFSLAISGILSVVFAPFDMPRAGNLPAKIIGSLFTFYLSVVFSVVLGCALLKCSDRLNLHRG